MRDYKKEKDIIDRVRQRIKQHSVVKEFWCDTYDLDLEEIDLIPMCFSDDIDVSARTDHGIIYFNISLLNDGDFENDDHYMVHELVHVAQQTTGSRPTKGSDDGEYLDNEEEVEGFQNQTAYLSDTRSEEDAEGYVDQVLDHHEVNNNKERNKRKKELLQIANK